jgi:hypothetical protein
MRILVMDGPPMPAATATPSRGHTSSAETGGHDVRAFRLREMHFDPILHRGLKKPSSCSSRSAA